MRHNIQQLLQKDRRWPPQALAKLFLYTKTPNFALLMTKQLHMLVVIFGFADL
jgi:hypothetical protein